MALPKKPKVVVKRNLKYRQAPVWGIATYAKEPLIELDSKLKKLDHLTILVHESVHLAYPDMTEKEVLAGSKLIASIIWGQNYRRVEQ